MKDVESDTYVLNSDIRMNTSCLQERIAVRCVLINKETFFFCFVFFCFVRVKIYVHATKSKLVRSLP